MKRELNEVLRANAKLLAVFDEEVEELAKKSVSAALGATSKDRSMPYWYSVYGEDQEPGVALTAYGENNPSVGYIRVQSDASFVATQLDFSFSSITPFSPKTLYKPPAGDLLVYGIRLYDESNYRWISLSDRTTNGQEGDFFPLSRMSPDWSLKQIGFSLANEVTFPRNALIRLEVFCNRNLFEANPRLHCSFCGYKVFGG